MDRNGQKQTEIDINGEKNTEMDRNQRNQTEVDRKKPKHKKKRDLQKQTEIERI